MSEGCGGIGAILVEWAFGVDGEGEPAVASEGGGAVLLWQERRSSKKEISAIRF
jgi:hypothetical protein